MIELSLFDKLIIFIYALILLLIGFWSKKKSDSSKLDFLLAGRNLTLPLFVMVTVATWYGGILGVGEFTYRYGINSWLTQGFPYYIFAILFAIFFSKKIRSTNLATIPERIEQVYNKKLSILLSFYILMIVTPAPYALMTGVIFKLFFGIPLWLGIVLGLFLSSIYLFYAGYRSDIYTDVYQFILMFAGFIALLIFSLKNFGSFNFIKENLPEELLIPFKNISFSYFLVWFFIGLWTFVDPGFHQRSYAAKNEKVAFYGLLLSVCCWFVFDFLTVSNGLFARAYLPDLENPVYTYLVYADKILPDSLKGLFISAILATIISTLNSYVFISAQTFGNDILKNFLKRNYNEVFLVRVGLLITLIISSTLAVLIPSVIDLWYTIGSIFIPGLLFPVVGSYYNRFRLNNKLTLIQSVSVTLISFVIYILREIHLVSIDIEPMIAGIVIGLVFQLSKIFIKGGKLQQQ
ncbi:MAG: sodium:solute symporter family protein [Ignavibacteria bacterium]